MCFCSMVHFPPPPVFLSLYFFISHLATQDISLFLPLILFDLFWDLAERIITVNIIIIIISNRYYC